MASVPRFEHKHQQCFKRVEGSTAGAYGTDNGIPAFSMALTLSSLLNRRLHQDRIQQSFNVGGSRVVDIR
jgi:hypothetical protein